MLAQVLSRFPGVSCAYMDAAGHVTTECYGLADRERNLPVNENTLFPACSISKFVTALCVMMLHEQHRLDIDAPVNRYLRQWKLCTPDGHESDAAVRALLSHTAGVKDGSDAFYGLRRGDPEVTLLDILEGRTAYNNRPVRAEVPQGTAFEYSDAGYCILQLLVEDVTGMTFADAARELLFDPLYLKNTFFASPRNVSHFEPILCMATGYDSTFTPLPGRFPPCPDLAASGLWSTPRELLSIAREFAAACHGRSALLPPHAAREMTAPVEKFRWTGLGLFMAGKDAVMSQGWGENGQCMLKINLRTGEIAAVMTNGNPDMSQEDSGVAWLADGKHHTKF